MTTQKVADRLVELCRQGQFETAQNELLSADARNIEPEGNTNSVQGRENIIAKGRQWKDSISEIHGMEISNPIISGDRFAVAMNMDLTYKNGQRAPMNELGIYEVKDGKIVSERFIY